MWWPFLLTIFGFILLIYGGGRVCAGASSLAVRFGISEFIIGVTIVAISTSAPELMTSVIAALNGHPEIVAGNVIGSNLVNIGLAGGLVALIRPFTITSRIIEKEMPFLFLVTCLFGVLAIFSLIRFFVGVLLVALNILYLYFICKNDQLTEEDQNVTSKISLGIDFGKALWVFLFGLLLLFLGAHFVISGSVELAHLLGWSDALIGFTIIAVGTSFPEIAVSLIAALRGYGSICTGNIIGSNIFNTLMITGSCAIFGPVSVNLHLCHFGIPSLVFLTALMWRFFTTRRKINRLEGLILFIAFVCVFSLSIYFQLS
ncbi:MAG: calcium/sodium antiporter [Puniceicoccales bacterium]|jgi:cation:H+ antiporter|nr:calcium/sodium antiporter [Puniceicoccales bacterium]